MRTIGQSFTPFFALILFSGQSNAAVTVTNFVLTTTTVSFDINGTFPATAPDELDDGLYFVNPTVSADPGFALGSFIEADTASFSGTQTLRIAPFPIQTGGTAFGDYFFVAFEDSFTIGEAISGSVNATWTGPAFDPSVVDTLNVQWGTGAGDTVGAGTQLTTVVIPEPSSTLLLGACALGLMIRRQRS